MYLIDGRGQHLLRSLGLSIFERLVTSAVAMADAKIGVLTPKGLTERVNPIKELPLYYANVFLYVCPPKTFLKSNLLIIFATIMTSED